MLLVCIKPLLPIEQNTSELREALFLGSRKAANGHNLDDDDEHHGGQQYQSQQYQSQPPGIESGELPDETASGSSVGSSDREEVEEARQEYEEAYEEAYGSD